MVNIILQRNLSRLSHIYMIKLTIEHDIKHFIYTFIHYNSLQFIHHTQKYTQVHTMTRNHIFN